MIEILENIYNFLGKIVPYSFVAGFIGFLTLGIARAAKNSKMRITGIILFAQLFSIGLLMIILQTTILRKIRNEVLEILADPKTELIISRNDFQILPQDLKKELLKIQDISPNHTGPENKKVIEVISPKGIFKITIGRDSGNKNQFWIFADKYEFSKEMEIGRVNSILIK